MRSVQLEQTFFPFLRRSQLVQARLQVEGRSVVRIDLVAPRGEECLEKELALEPYGRKRDANLRQPQPQRIRSARTPRRLSMRRDRHCWADSVRPPTQAPSPGIPPRVGRQDQSFFAAAAVGDSHLVSVRMVAEEQRQKHEPDAGKDEMDVDLDDGMSMFSLIIFMSNPPIVHTLVQICTETR
jgi:hypothetical protein